jgi:hypothetical protein
VGIDVQNKIITVAGVPVDEKEGEMAAKPTCRACGHRLSDHRGGKPTPRPSSTACRDCNACDKELNG